jgi:GTPase SAR1 family protein
MLVSPKFAKKHKFHVKSQFVILGGSLDNAKLTLIDPSEGDPNLKYDVDYKNVFGTNLNILDPQSKIFIAFDKAKIGSNGKRLTFLVSGPSGCGKTTFCINYMNIYRKQLKDPEKYPIYFLASITDDRRAEKIPGCTVINMLDEEMVDYYLIDPETRLSCRQDFFGKSPLNNALIVIDDAENMDKMIRLALDNLLSNIMKFGRHSNTNLIWSRHILSNKDTLIQESLSELMYFVLFKDMSSGKLNYFCKKYLDYGPSLSDWIRKFSGSRYTIVHNRCPYFMLNDDKISLVS